MSEHGAGLLRDVHGVPERQDRPHPARDPERRRSADRSKDQLGVEGQSVILTFGLLSPDKGIEHVIDALPAILARYPGHGLHRARRHAPARQGAARRDLPADAGEPRPAARRRREHHLPQPLRQRRPSWPSSSPPPTSTSRRTSRRSRSPRGRWPTRSAPARPSSRRPTATRASCSPTGAASSSRGATRPRSRARSSTCSATSARRLAMCAARGGVRARHGLAGGGPALPRDASSARAPSTPTGAAPSSRRKTLAERPAELPEIEPRSRPPDDRRHRHPAARGLQRPALRGRLLPRRQRARAAR